MAGLEHVVRDRAAARTKPGAADSATSRASVETRWAQPVSNYACSASLDVRRAGKPLAQPPSKKTRALLAYLALTRRPHRRETLCNLFWDVTDDPRGALRWSLSKLRKQVDDERETRLDADRERVGLELRGASVDVLEMRSALDERKLADAADRADSRLVQPQQRRSARRSGSAGLRWLSSVAGRGARANTPPARGDPVRARRAQRRQQGARARLLAHLDSGRSDERSCTALADAAAR